MALVHVLHDTVDFTVFRYDFRAGESSASWVFVVKVDTSATCCDSWNEFKSHCLVTPSIFQNNYQVVHRMFRILQGLLFLEFY